jgi:predicted alpha/beta-hydrolase family hydrolase
VRGLIALAATAALLWGLWQLEQMRAGLRIERVQVGTMPVTLFKPQGEAPAPLVVIAHGFAGSQQLMQPLALTLARNGYTALTFDFPGHGRNPAPMTGGLADQYRSLEVLLAALAAVTRWAAPIAQGEYAILGHSMASDIVVRHAQAHPEVRATVALSLFAPSITEATPPDRPRNLIVIDGALEPQVMHREALRVIGRVAGPGAQERVTYGRFEDGTARRAVYARGVEHIAVLYGADTATEALAWLDRAHGRSTSGTPFIAAYGPPLAALLLGLLGIAWVMAGALPVVAAGKPALVPAVTTAARSASTSPWRWRRFALLAVLPALATPLLLWKVPTDFLPVLLGDYLALHFALYGLLTGLALRWSGGAAVPAADRPALLVAVPVVAAFGLLAIGMPIDRYLFNLAPTPVRWPVIVALAAGTLPWFLADEALTRSVRAPRGAYFGTKACFLVSLALAIALNPHQLFFLALIVPAILLLFIAYGLLSRWTFRRTRHPFVAAIANAAVFAWFMAVTFPLVA